MKNELPSFRKAFRMVENGGPSSMCSFSPTFRDAVRPDLKGCPEDASHSTSFESCSLKRNCYSNNNYPTLLQWSNFSCL